MKMLTKDLDGMALRWALAQCSNQPIRWCPHDREIYMGEEPGGDYAYNPDVNWDLGGPMFEQLVDVHEKRDGYFYCWTSKSFGYGQMRGTHATGPTLLIAGGRCIVASRMGMEIDVPDYLVEQPKAQAVVSPSQPAPTARSFKPR